MREHDSVVSSVCPHIDHAHPWSGVRGPTHSCDYLRAWLELGNGSPRDGSNLSAHQQMNEERCAVYILFGGQWGWGDEGLPWGSSGHLRASFLLAPSLLLSQPPLPPLNKALKAVPRF